MTALAGSCRLRRAHTGDAAALTAIALAAKAWWGYPQAFMSACEDELTVTPAAIEAPGFHYHRAIVDETVAGFYGLDLRAQPRAELDALFVLPRWIGQGIGRELLRHCVGFAAAGGVDCIEIQSDPHAEAFYTRLGAVRVGERASGSIPGRVLPLLEIRIEPAALGDVAGTPGDDAG